MYTTINKNNSEIGLFADDSDLCYTCSNFEGCPLMSAVQDEVVVLRYEKIHVKECAMFREFSFDQIIAFGSK